MTAELGGGRLVQPDTSTSVPDASPAGPAWWPIPVRGALLDSRLARARVPRGCCPHLSGGTPPVSESSQLSRVGPVRPRVRSGGESGDPAGPDPLRGLTPEQRAPIVRSLPCPQVGGTVPSVSLAQDPLLRRPGLALLHLRVRLCAWECLTMESILRTGHENQSADTSPLAPVPASLPPTRTPSWGPVPGPRPAWHPPTADCAASSPSRPGCPPRWPFPLPRRPLLPVPSWASPAHAGLSASKASPGPEGSPFSPQSPPKPWGRLALSPPRSALLSWRMRDVGGSST